MTTFIEAMAEVERLGRLKGEAAAEIALTLTGDDAFGLDDAFFCVACGGENDNFPQPDLSGQTAGEPTGWTLAANTGWATSVGMHVDDDRYADSVLDLCAAYEAAFTTGAHRYFIKKCREALDEAEL